MSKSCWIGGVAVALLLAAAVRAEGPFDGPSFWFTPVAAAKAQVDPGQAVPIKLSDYWLGLACHPVPPPVRAQLDIPEGQGLLVQNVVPDGPAAGAGIKQYDVLLKAGDKPLATIKDLVDAVELAKEKKLSLELLRGGKSQTINVVPAKRPADARPGGPLPDITDPNWGAVQKWLEQMRPGKEGKPPFRFRFFHPGAILPPGAPAHPPLPGNMSVTITKQGDKPAKIVAKKDDKTWELTEDDLDQLPDEIRPHVEAMLGRVPPDPGLGGRIEAFDFLPDWGNQSDVQPMLPPESRIEKRMEELNRRMEQLRKSIDQMRKQRPRLKSPEKNEKKPDKT